MPRQTEKRNEPRNYKPLALVGLVVVVWLAWWQWDRVQRLFGDAPEPARPGVATTLPVEPPVAASDPAREEAERRWTALLGRSPVWPDDLEAPRDCAAVEADLARLCAVLDSRDYVGAARVPGGACGLIQEFARKMVSRPPLLSSELKSYRSILANVFHLFRVMGRERVELLRKIVAEETELAEPAALAVYRWLASRESCARSGQTSIRLVPLYDYASFLFGTLGGQAYLRRRSPDTEALVGFYALLILDRADRQGHNPHGVDPRAEIRRARALIASRPWVFAEHYRQTLDEIAARWKDRAAER